MDMMSLVYYVGGGGIVLVILVVASNVLVSTLTKQVTERALLQFQHTLSQEVAKALAAFKEGVCEQMAMQERKSDSLAKLYSSLIDILRIGKEFVTSVSGKEQALAEKKLLSFEATSRSFCEQCKKQSLHFDREFKLAMDGYVVEQEAFSQFLVTQWNSGKKEFPEKREIGNEQIRQAWSKAEDRTLAVMDLMRNEFRKRVQPPESIMKKWLSEPGAPKKQQPAADQQAAASGD